MDQATELLNSLTTDEIEAYTATPQDEEHLVIGEDRFVTVPDELKRIAVQYDHIVETVTFDCPRYWDEHDLSQMVIYVNYLPEKGVVGSSICTNVRVDEADDSIIHFDWTITDSATYLEGTLIFLVDAKGANGEHWHSELNKDMFVSEGLEPPEQIDIGDPELLTQILLFNASATELNRNTIELYENTLLMPRVYIGAGDMPEDCNVQIDPDGGESGVYMFAPVETNMPYATEVTIAPNKMTVIDRLEGAIDISLAPGTAGLHNEWDVTITQSTSDAFAVTFPSEVHWGFGMAPTFDVNTTTICRLYYVGETLCGEWVTV